MSINYHGTTINGGDIPSGDFIIVTTARLTAGSTAVLCEVCNTCDPEWMFSDPNGRVSHGMCQGCAEKSHADAHMVGEVWTVPSLA